MRRIQGRQPAQPGSGWHRRYAEVSECERPDDAVSRLWSDLRGGLEGQGESQDEHQEARATLGVHETYIILHARRAEILGNEGYQMPGMSAFRRRG